MSTKKKPCAPHPAAAINKQHRLYESTNDLALGHAIRCGQLLQKQKDSMLHGKWMKWIDAHCDFSRSTAVDYMRAAGQKARGLVIRSLAHSKSLEAKAKEKRPFPKAVGNVKRHLRGFDPYIEVRDMPEDGLQALEADWRFIQMLAAQSRHAIACRNNNEPITPLESLSPDDFRRAYDGDAEETADFVGPYPLPTQAKIDDKWNDIAEMSSTEAA